jgi:hypothetical protein
MAVSDDGSSYITGEFAAPIRFGEQELSATAPYQTFVVKYDDAGEVIWARQSTGEGTAIGYSVATTRDGSAYVAGQSDGKEAWSGTPLESDEETAFVVKYRADGSVDWVSKGTGQSTALAIATTSDGTAYIAGGFLGEAHFGELTLNGSLTEFSAFLAELDGSGTPLAVAPVAASGFGRAIAVQDGCSPQVAGTFAGGLGDEDVFVSTVDLSAATIR